MSWKYEDIVNLPHHRSPKRVAMSMTDRGAQFSPFAALTGHEDAVRETARLTDKCIELDESVVKILDTKLQFLADRLVQKPVVEISYFKADKKKQGGSYEKITGTVKKIDLHGRKIIMEEGNSIAIDDLIEINGRIFESSFF